MKPLDCKEVKPVHPKGNQSWIFTGRTDVEAETRCRALPLPLSIFPSIRVFYNESGLRIRWSKEWSFSFSISPSSEYSRMISFRIDQLDLLAVEGTLKNLFQHHRSKASVLPMNTQDWSPLGWIDWISLLSKGLSRVFSNTTVQKHQFFGAQLSL